MSNSAQSPIVTDLFFTGNRWNEIVKNKASFLLVSARFDGVTNPTILKPEHYLDLKMAARFLLLKSI